MTMATLTAPAADPLPRFITVPQFCDRFQLSRSYAYELLSAGKIRSVRIGAARRIPIAAVQQFADSLTGGDFPTGASPGM